MYPILLYVDGVIHTNYRILSPLSLVVRTLPFQGRDRGFESHSGYSNVSSILADPTREGMK